MTADSPPEASNPVLAPDHPASLRRLAPQALSIQPGTRRHPPQVSPTGVHVQAGRKYFVRVLPQAPDLDDTIHHAGLDVEGYVKALGPAQEVPRSDGRKEYALHFACSALLRPFPTRTSISVRLHHTRWGDYCQHLSLVVWPSWRNQVIWAFTVFFLPMWMQRLTQICLVDGHVRPLTEITDKLQESQDFLLISLAVTFGGGCLVRLLGWAAQLVAAPDG